MDEESQKENNEELKENQLQNNVDEGHEEKGGENGEEKTEEQKEEKEEEKTEEKLEEKPDESTEEKADEKPEEKVEEKIEEKPEEKIEEKVEEKKVENSEEKVEEKKVENNEEKIDNSDEANIKQNLEEKLDKNEDEKHEEKSDGKLEEKEVVKENQEEKPKEEILEKHIEVEKEENINKESKETENIIMERLNGYQINHDYIFRICMVGDAGVGKTSLLTRFCDNTFNNNYTSTIGVDFKVVTLKYQNIITKLHVWDTAGQERFKSMAINYFRSSHGFMFIYDITEKESFENIQNWIDLAFSNSNTVGINFLVGNKSDIENQRQISKDTAKDFANEKNLIFFETSAKSNENVEKVFQFFTYKLIQYFLNNKDKYINSDLSGAKISKNAKDINPNKEEESKCSC